MTGKELAASTSAIAADLKNLVDENMQFLKVFSTQPRAVVMGERDIDQIDAGKNRRFTENPRGPAAAGIFV